MTEKTRANEARKDDPDAPSGSDDAALGDRKGRDAALVLPLAGLALLTAPIITLFTAEPAVFGAPSVVVYMFGVWAALIAAAWRLSKRLEDEDPS